MNAYIILVIALLSAGVVLGDHAYVQAADTSTGSMQNNERSLSEEGSMGLRMTAQNFIENVNSARVALAMKNSSSAKQYIDKANQNLTELQNLTPEQRRFSRLSSSRLSYGNDEYRYFPVPGQVKMTKVKDGPFWAREGGIAVTDAEMVYITLDLSDIDDTKKSLTEAKTAVSKGDLSKADNKLDNIIDDTINMEKVASLPLDKARDNIALTRSFLQARNYSGARYALKHADKGLDEMQRDDRYQARRQTVSAMRQEIKSLEKTIDKRDPSILQKTEAKLGEWWNELKGWANDRDSTSQSY
ncbi:MAG: YfdX family protein [Dongiaceae bacterium]